MLKRSKLSKMPPFIYSNIWNSNEEYFSEFHSMDFLSGVRDHLSQRQLLSNVCRKDDCYICDRIYTDKSIKEREKKIKQKRLENLIRVKGKKRKERRLKVTEKGNILLAVGNALKEKN